MSRVLNASRRNVLKGGAALLAFHGLVRRQARAAPRHDDARGGVTFSVRPQSMRLNRLRPDPADQRVAVAVRIAERAYLGEFWDYIVVPHDGTVRLKVTAPPPDVLAVGDPVWLEIDPQQMAPIA